MTLRFGAEVFNRQKGMMRLAAFIALCIPLLAVAQPVVPGFERFPRDTPAQQVTGGEVLITELNCVACHVAGEDACHFNSHG